MPSLHVTAPAKLNLFLHLTGKRPDGLHILDSLVTFTDFGDTIDIQPADELMLSVEGPFASAINAGEDNLVLRAARLLMNHVKYKGGAHLTLHKHIPVGAGLGGGSSDAAATLLGLRRMWDLQIKDAVLQMLAMSIGSDIPACLAQRPVIVRGAGELVTPVEVHPHAWAVLVNPNTPLPTADVYKNFSGAFDAPSGLPPIVRSLDALVHYLTPKQNALAPSATALLPVINDILAAITATDGCRLARMSGSGATCFGLYENEAASTKAAAAISKAHSGWWVQATKLMEGS